MENPGKEGGLSRVAGMPVSVGAIERFRFGARSSKTSTRRVFMWKTKGVTGGVFHYIFDLSSPLSRRQCRTLYLVD